MRVKTMIKVAVPALAAFAVASAAFAVLPGTDGSRKAAPAMAQEPVAKAYVGDPENPATWKLPVEAYMPTKAQNRLVSATRDDVIKNCMSQAGFPAWKPAPDLPTLGGATLTDWRYGIHDLSQAEQDGYHPDPAAQAAYDEALASDQSGNADQDVLQQCASQADGPAPSLQQNSLIDQISGDSYSASMSAPAVKEAFANWSACMKSQGFSYATPMDASDDVRFSADPEVSQAEKETAVADVKCRDKYHVEKTWFDAESALQQTVIAKHLDEFNKAKADIKTVVAKAQATSE